MTVGDGTDLVTAVVQALARSATGATGAPLGPDLVARLRERLFRTGAGAWALGQVEAAPESEPARAHLADAVRALLATEPELAQQVQAGLAAAGQIPTPLGVGGDHLANAPRRNRIGTVVGVLVVLAGLIALGLHFGGHGGAQPGRPNAGQGGGVLPDPARAQSVLPDLQALPAGWQLQDGPTSTTALPACAAAATDLSTALCDGLYGYANESFTDGNGTEVDFGIYTGRSAGWASTAYDRLTGLAGKAGTRRLTPLPGLGDRASTGEDDQGGGVIVQFGSTLLVVSEQPQDSATGWDHSNGIALARMFVNRTQQALDGRTPTAGMPR
ncbi:hypothetical protein [Kitasatospora sp. LaBMicrA B282]|uniref:hypothetical protein n=1 Tax=Kitasatospora sp. LaBMicrA B282 TaxID=3420949 RepID=UPI003D114CD5